MINATDINLVLVFFQTNMPGILACSNVICGGIEVSAESTRTLCLNKEYRCNGEMDYISDDEHEDMCIFSHCACPLPDCNFFGSSEQLSLHFSSKHWDSGRRFQYNNPLKLSLGMNEQFLVLQAEKDGILFLLSKVVESVGNTLTITCVRPSSSKENFLYDIMASKGASSLRLKSSAEYFPGKVEGSLPMDFLLVPFRFIDSSGNLSLEVCIWNSREIGSDCFL